jgi:hypothetical protein
MDVTTAPYRGCEEYSVRMIVMGNDGYCKEVEQSYYARGKAAHKRIQTYIERHTPELVRVIRVSYV